ncbi:uridine kinase [Rubrivirga sp. S365]|uniref:Uridine kinase n=1 Tax=Rubrivirga litoralis TaxID=3075598 RepID=A0ABU3BUA4_9BACT|nr:MULTISPECIES: uridine kinase [unclassified Rubrivirga]MDT0632858.1 uridine kinase [Rubrivirga sp. F394]MDT7855162.1 uridine kinase [Rubrivirga sp. S365]
MSVVIGIAGGSGSGKTTVQRRVMERFGPRRIALLDHDAYYHDLAHLEPDQRARFNFDHPDALESDLLVDHLDRLLAGEPVQKPTYSFETHRRLEETETVEPRPVILVDGILVLAEPALRVRMDVKLYVDAAPDVRLMRRIERDLHERGRSVESVLDQYRRTVRPMHLEFVEPSKRHADVIIPRGGRNEVAIDMVLARVQSLLDLDH